MAGLVYLLHADRRHRHAGHYTGSVASAERLATRLAQHLSGRGARLPAVFVEHGIRLTLVRTWDADRPRLLERRIKNRKNAPRECPVCAAQMSLPLRGHGRRRAVRGAGRAGR